jgi:uncharacterized protein
MPIDPATLTPDLAAKLDRVQRILGDLGSALVTYSGGVDSTLLLRLAHDVLGPRAVGLISTSASLPARERAEAEAWAGGQGIRLIAIETRELDQEAYARNDTERCYHCKAALLDQALAVAAREGLAHVLLGTNADDLSDHRPGHRAATERGARAPLLEAGLGKAEVRLLSRALGLPTAEKPEMACLASRIPYGSRVTREWLSMVERLEDGLRGLGFDQVRVRHHGTVARIEIAPERLPELVAPGVREAVVAQGKAAGFQYVAVDLMGYRRGALNEGHPEARPPERPRAVEF